MLVSLTLGAVVGVILGLTGAGGGILAVPLLVFGLHMGVAQAGPIGLMAVAMAAALGAALGLRQGIVRYKAAMLVASIGMVVAPFGLWLAQRMPGRHLTLLFSLVLAVVAWRAFQRGRSGGDVVAGGGGCVPCILDPGTGRFAWNFRCARALLGAGALVGFMSGLLGVGGGFVLVPALQRCTNLPLQSIVATSLAVSTLVSSSSVLAAALAGNVAWSAGLPFAAGALLGMLAGRKLGPLFAPGHLNIGFAALSGAVALAMLGKAVL